MTKFNWERVAAENRIAKYGSEFVGELEGRKQAKKARKKLKASSSRQGMSRSSFQTCPICSCHLNSKNLARHMKKVHPEAEGNFSGNYINCAGAGPSSKPRIPMNLSGVRRDPTHRRGTAAIIIGSLDELKSRVETLSDDDLAQFKAWFLRFVGE